MLPGKIILHKGKELSLERRHPWIFSGAVKNAGNAADGDLVDVLSSEGSLLGRGHYSKGSIAVRMLTFSEEPVDAGFWDKMLRQAFRYRNTFIPEDTNAFRLVHGEGDGLPGLIVDIYGPVAVMQSHTAGMWKMKEEIAAALMRVGGNRIRAVYDKSRQTINKNDSWVSGKGESPGVIMENGLSFMVDWEVGQKTGFFLDQRDNRKLLMEYSGGRHVLNAFCYTGGFSVYAKKGGAASICSVDSSAPALELAGKNMELNGFADASVTYSGEDAFGFFDKYEGKADLIVLDPPAFAKSRRVTHNAIMGYKRLNRSAISSIAPGGILFTFSCSQAIDRKTFYGTVMSAAIGTGRTVRVMHHLSQSPDHPVSIYHPEGEYLKGLVLEVE